MSIPVGSLWFFTSKSALTQVEKITAEPRAQLEEKLKEVEESGSRSQSCFQLQPFKSRSELCLDGLVLVRTSSMNTNWAGLYPSTGKNSAAATKFSCLQLFASTWQNKVSRGRSGCNHASVLDGACTIRLLMF